MQPLLQLFSEFLFHLAVQADIQTGHRSLCYTHPERILGEKDFDTYETGAVLLNDDGRRKVLTKWQEKKKTTIVHPYLKKKIALGLVPYLQANLLTKYLRGEIDEYQCFLL